MSEKHVVHPRDRECIYGEKYSGGGAINKESFVEMAVIMNIIGEGLLKLMESHKSFHVVFEYDEGAPRVYYTYSTPDGQ